MSYRDLRNFSEMMRVLGYPRLISIENFRNPNFPLVAEVLIWLVDRIDPSAGLSSDISEENDRVHLIRSASELLALKAGLKLNTKKLYQADGYAVRELLKVATLLFNSLNAEITSSEGDSHSVVDTVLKTEESSRVRQLVAEITTSGATLFDLLGKEPELREQRHSKASRLLDMAQVESSVKEAIANVGKEISKTKDLINNVAANEAALDTKIEKKKSDLERHTKRLQSLKKMRPAYMEEFEKLEEELKVLYVDYVIKARNETYLESVLEQLEALENEERELKQASARRALEDMKNDEPMIEPLDVLSNIEDRGLTKTGGKIRASAAKGVRKSFGSMTGDLEDSDSLDDSDSDILLDGDLTEEEEEPKSLLKDLSEDDF